LAKPKTLSVSAIKTGTVIDHIAVGQALKIVRLLQFDRDERRVTIGLNLQSKSMGLKDLIKIEDVLLSEEQACHIAIFSPQATVNLIENFKIVRKFCVALPPAIYGVLSCANPRCITCTESIATLFQVEAGSERVWLRCHHCEHIFSLEGENTY
jgi:aspartate carbamoyltransferase regulatory subunit